MSKGERFRICHQRGRDDVGIPYIPWLGPARFNRVVARKKRYFCSGCGSPIYSQYDEAMNVLYVRIGTIDDDSELSPDIHIHVGSKAPWYEIRDDLPQSQEEEGLTF